MTRPRGYTEAMNKQRYSPNEVGTALLDANGNAAEAARALGCSWATVRRYMLRYPELEVLRRGARIVYRQGVTDADLRRAWWRNYLEGVIE